METDRVDSNANKKEIKSSNLHWNLLTEPSESQNIQI